MLLALALVTHAFVQPVAVAQEEARRGWIGVSLEVDAERDRPLSAGEVVDGSPAQAADLRAGDRLLALDGRALSSYDELNEFLRERGPGSEVTLTVRRALEVELDERGFGAGKSPRLGVHLGQLDDGDGPHWIVRQAERDWPAARAGVRAGDRIVSLDGRTPGDFDELQAVLAGVEPQDELELVIERDLKLRLGARPDPERAQRLLPRTAAPAPAPADLERQLREEVAALNEELRALREELRTLRRELVGWRAR